MDEYPFSYDLIKILSEKYQPAVHNSIIDVLFIALLDPYVI